MMQYLFTTEDFNLKVMTGLILIINVIQTIRSCAAVHSQTAQSPPHQINNTLTHIVESNWQSLKILFLPYSDFRRICDILLEKKHLQHTNTALHSHTIVFEQIFPLK